MMGPPYAMSLEATAASSSADRTASLAAACGGSSFLKSLRQRGGESVGTDDHGLRAAN